MTFDTWRRYTWEHPDCDHEVSTAAVTEGQVVGTSFVYTERDSGRAANAGTGVMRAYRARGLGLLLKQHSPAAAAAGITRVITENDETNAPMRKAGFRAFRDRAPLSADPAGACFEFPGMCGERLPAECATRHTLTPGAEKRRAGGGTASASRSLIVDDGRAVAGAGRAFLARCRGARTGRNPHDS